MRFISIRLAALPFGEHDGKIVLRERIAELSSELVPRNRLWKILRHALSRTVHDPKLKLGGRVIIVRGLLDPVCRGHRICRHAGCVQIHHTEGILSFGIPCLGGFRIPLDSVACFDLFGIDTVFAEMNMAKLKGRACMAAFGRLFQQFFGAGRIARHALALQIQHGQRHLCFPVAGLSRFRQ